MGEPAPARFRKAGESDLVVTEILVPIVILLLFPVWTWFVLFVLSYVSGWRALARNYVLAEGVGRREVFSIRLGYINYLVVACFETGLVTLRLPWPLGSTHGPVTIPSEAIRLSEDRPAWTRKRTAFIGDIQLQLRASPRFFEAAGVL